MKIRMTSLWQRSKIASLAILLVAIGLFGWLLKRTIQMLNEFESTAADTVVQSIDGIQTALEESAAAQSSTPAADSPIGENEHPAGWQKISEEAESGFAEQRRAMVMGQLEERGISDERVLDAMLRVPRHRLVPPAVRSRAYADSPQPIGYGQTISQPYIVALMTELVRPRPDSRALDVGTGSGYQAAVLAELCAEVYSIEILEPLASRARRDLEELGYRNITLRCGDGYRGWPEHAPFDVIIVAAAPTRVPQPLLEQLAVGGRLVIPIGSRHQELRLFEKQPDGRLRETTIAAVAFVPMTGEARDRGE